MSAQTETPAVKASLSLHFLIPSLSTGFYYFHILQVFYLASSLSCCFSLMLDIYHQKQASHFNILFKTMFLLSGTVMQDKALKKPFTLN